MSINASQVKDKPTLLDLREKYGLNIVWLAEKSRVKPLIVYYMLLGRPVRRSQALQVLRGLSRVTGTKYALEDVNVVLAAEASE